MSHYERIAPRRASKARKSITIEQIAPDGASTRVILNTANPIEVPDAFPDGLLPLTVADNDLLVRIPVDPTLPPFSDTTLGGIQLRWKDANYGQMRRITQADLAGPYIDMVIDQNDLVDEGISELTYIALSYPGGNPYTGTPAWQIEVDRTAPGGGQLGSPHFDQAIVDSAVTPDKLNQNDELECTIPEWRDFKPGDVVIPRFSLNQGMGPWFEAPEVEIIGSMPALVTAAFPRALLERYGDGRHYFSYTVTDRAGNRSIGSDEQPLQVLLRDVPGTLPKPTIPLAENDGFILEADARTPVDVHIPLYDKAQEGDSITVHWGGLSLAPEPVLDSDLGNDPLLLIRVPYSLVQAAGDGSIVVNYSLARGGFPLGTSDDADTFVVDLTQPGGPDPDPGTPEHGNLQVLSVLGESQTLNIITPDDYEKNADITIPHEGVDGASVFEVGDVITVRWNTLGLIQNPLVAADLGQDYQVVITSAQMKQVGSGAIPVGYEITRALSNPAGASNTVFSAYQTVQVTSGDLLPGGTGGLDVGEFSDAIDNPFGDSVLNSAAVESGSTAFKVSSYLNIAVGDVIEFRFIAHDGYGSATEVPASEFTGTRIVSSDDVGRGYYEFDIPSANIYLAGSTGVEQGRGDAYGRYSITNTHGTAVGDEVFVLIDAQPRQP